MNDLAIPHLGELLREWRAVRGRSQLELSTDTGISQRQISFIESGRSVPGRATLISISTALQIPLRDRNDLFLSAGYAPAYSVADWSSEDMTAIRQALQRMLTQHEPYPAFVMDRHWNVLFTNTAAPRFFSNFVNLDARPARRNLLRLLLDPQGLRPFIANCSELVAALIERVLRESVGQVLTPESRAILNDLRAHSKDAPQRPSPRAGSMLPMIPIDLFKDGQTMSYFSLLTTVGAPQTVAAQELRVECMFPSDESTESLHHRVMAEVSL